MEDLLQLQATIDGVKTLKNNTLKISLETQDIARFRPEEIATLFSMNDKLFWIALKEIPLKEEEIDIPEPQKELKSDKSSSQRLRSVIYVLWEQGGKSGDFETFYKDTMEKLIDFIKGKLD